MFFTPPSVPYTVTNHSYFFILHIHQKLRVWCIEEEICYLAMYISQLKLIIFLSLANPLFTLSKNEEYKLDNSEREHKISLRVLKIGNLESNPIKLGSKVQVKIKSFSPSLDSNLTGEVVQTFQVGKHNITPLNEALLDMRIGEVRRLGVPISSYGKIFYEFSLLDVYPDSEL